MLSERASSSQGRLAHSLAMRARSSLFALSPCSLSSLAFASLPATKSHDVFGMRLLGFDRDVLARRPSSTEWRLGGVWFDLGFRCSYRKHFATNEYMYWYFGLGLRGPKHSQVSPTSANSPSSACSAWWAVSDLLQRLAESRLRERLSLKEFWLHLSWRGLV